MWIEDLIFRINDRIANPPDEEEIEYEEQDPNLVLEEGEEPPPRVPKEWRKPLEVSVADAMTSGKAVSEDNIDAILRE